MRSNIVSVAWKKNAPNANVLSIKSISDNLENTATFFWELIVHTPATSGTTAVNNTVDCGNITISGSTYTAWEGDNIYPFTYALAQLGLTAS